MKILQRVAIVVFSGGLGAGVVGSMLPIGSTAMPAVAEAAELCSAQVADRNNDGYIDGTEYAEYGHGAFSDWDANKDGYVDRDEFVKCFRSSSPRYDPKQQEMDWQQAWRDETWGRWDRNRDERLEPAEAFGAGTFDTWDFNKDGLVDTREFPY